MKPLYVVDTSVLLDSRIRNPYIARIFPGKFIVPKFIVNELERMMNTPYKAIMGVRGLQTIELLKTMKSLELSTFDCMLVSEDDRLIECAKQLGATILTNDARLEQIAEARGVNTINLNRLLFTLMLGMLPGDEITVKITRLGRRDGQGVGDYDGLSIFVEGGSSLLGSSTQVKIKQILVSPSGRTIFGKPIALP